MSHYKTLRTWSGLLVVLGAISMISAGFGVISWMVAVDGFWETMGVLCFGAPLVLLLASWPIALGQAFRAIADIGDVVSLSEESVGRYSR